MDRPLRVLVVDDHKLMRMGLASLFGSDPRFDLAGEAETAPEAVSAARRTRPDVIVMDVRLPEGSGIEACREIRSERPETRVVMLTSYADEDTVIDSIMAGAAGYLLKSSDPARLLDALEAAMKGQSLLDPAVAETVLAWMRRGETTPTDARDPLAGLSGQERSILRLIADGKTNREIARDLDYSEHTVKGYVSAILQKLNLGRRSEAAAYLARSERAQDT